MKKDVYFVIGIIALGLTLFVGAFYIYQKKQNFATNASNDQATNIARVDQSLLIRDWSPSLGPSMSRVVVVEFLDPECESCRAMHPAVKKLLQDYDGKIRYVLRYMPFHQNSALAAKWLEASREQNKFWEALNALFEKQPDWGSHHHPKPELIPSILSAAGIDIALAKSALENPAYEKRIQDDKEDGKRIGVTATPTFFVNGRMLLELGDAPLRSLIEEELKSPQ